jgi:hypothetical protein
METEVKFTEWVILEVYGHRRLAGKATESNILGGSLLRLDIPDKEEKFTTQFYGPGAIFSMTPVSEEIARKVAIQNQPEPVHRWEFKQLIEPKSSDFNNDDPRDGWPNTPDNYSNDPDDDDP